uniref:DRBM domain-containing protein n=1 Tax=Otus sunia TaxID=257818 RepID=A0A8C8AKM5_9STRI
MLAANPGKTPISLLQEYGTRIGKTPGYDLLKAEGQAHQPNFTFRVTVGDISCTGGPQFLGCSGIPWNPKKQVVVGESLGIPKKAGPGGGPPGTPMPEDTQGAFGTPKKWVLVGDCPGT